MRVTLTTPQISWHARAPILAIDAQPPTTTPHRTNRNYPRLLATAAAKSAEPDGAELRLWALHDDGATKAPSFVQDLAAHDGTVNAVRFSPDGATLASGADDHHIVLWRDRGRPVESLGAEESAGTWGAILVLRGHVADVYDLSWAPDSRLLVSGGVDGKIRIWNTQGKTQKEQEQQILHDHDHYVQGVGWDPRGAYVVSLSCDRSARVYSTGAKLRGSAPKQGEQLRAFAVVTRSARAATVSGSAASSLCVPSAEAPEDACLTSDATGDAGATTAEKEARHRLFLDDSVQTFFRRPSWSPDGAFLLLPCGQHQARPGGPMQPTTLVFARANLKEPCAHLPGPSKPVVAVRCCPVLFELREPLADVAASSTGSGAAVSDPAIAVGDAAACSLGAADAVGAAPRAPQAWMGLPHRVVWAVATIDSLLLYDSQQPKPLLLASGMHYAALTDLTWVVDHSGTPTSLLVSSNDGYCSILHFEPGELGAPLAEERLPQCMHCPLAPTPPECADSVSTAPARVEACDGVTDEIKATQAQQVTAAPPAVSPGAGAFPKCLVSNEGSSGEEVAACSAVVTTPAASAGGAPAYQPASATHEPVLKKQKKRAVLITLD